jgi:hypothetical protein
LVSSIENDINAMVGFKQGTELDIYEVSILEISDV